jgi:predicted regulator of Ras-like GTPase activity (Roadblock/LC7/MglB family)
MSDELRVDSGALIFATLADVYISSGMIDEAISILKDGLARNPNYHLAKIILGRAHFLKGDVDKAIETIESIYEEVKDSESANLYLGHCYRKLNDNEKARKYYEATLKINPDNMEALHELEKLIPDFTPQPQVEITEPPPVVEPVVEEPQVSKVAETPIEEVEVAAVEEETEQAKAVVEETETAEIAASGPVVEEAEIPQREAVVEELDESEVALAEQVIEELPEKIVEIESMPLEALDKPVKRLLDLDTVKGVFLSTKDGLLIKNYDKGKHDIETTCASIAAICMDVDESFRLLKRGGLTRCIIEKSDETLCVMAVGDSLLTVVTRVEAKPGLVFVYARKIIEEIEEILG